MVGMAFLSTRVPIVWPRLWLTKCFSGWVRSVKKALIISDCIVIQTENPFSCGRWWISMELNIKYCIFDVAPTIYWPLVPFGSIFFLFSFSFFPLVLLILVLLLAGGGALYHLMFRIVNNERPFSP